MTGTLNIDVPRNGHWIREITLVDQDDLAIDITDAVIEASARDIPGGTVIASATIEKTDSAAGQFNLLWDGDDFSGFGSVTEVARPTWDLKVTDGGIIQVPVRGYLNLLPENTP